jgi:hypothetical protein
LIYATQNYGANIGYPAMLDKIVADIKNRPGARVSAADALALRHLIAATPLYLRVGTGLWKTRSADGL